MRRAFYNEDLDYGNSTLGYYNKLLKNLNLEMETLATMTAQLTNLLKKNPYLVDDTQGATTNLREFVYIMPLRRNPGLELDEIGWIKESCLFRGVSFETQFSRRIECLKIFLDELKEGKELLLKTFCELVDGLNEQETKYRGKLSQYRSADGGELHFIMPLTFEGLEAAAQYTKMRKNVAGLLAYLNWMKQSSIYELIKKPVFAGDETELDYVRSLLHKAKELRIKASQFDIF
ncbi:MAG: hypothetical protein IJ274_03635 [Lachnospiraceae bacterium]|nr:hypothetical protein [Lachnospiraceae bacterium]